MNQPISLNQPMIESLVDPVAELDELIEFNELSNVASALIDMVKCVGLIE